jgi:ribosome recycling factor
VKRIINLIKHKLANLGQISKKAQMIAINFSKNPSAIHHAKNDLQAAFPDVNVQQEGVFLYINTPPISRERRTEMVAKVRVSLLNDYKKALDKVNFYSMKGIILPLNLDVL